MYLPSSSVTVGVWHCGQRGGSVEGAPISMIDLSQRVAGRVAFRGGRVRGDACARLVARAPRGWFGIHRSREVYGGIWRYMAECGVRVLTLLDLTKAVPGHRWDEGTCRGVARGIYRGERGANGPGGRRVRAGLPGGSRMRRYMAVYG